MFCKGFSKILGKTVTKKDIKSHKVVGSVRLSASEIFQVQDEAWENWREIPLTEKGLVRSLRALIESAIQIVVATSGPQRRAHLVQEWLRFNEVPYGEFYALGPKVLKTAITSDVLVDDAPEQVEAFVDRQRTGILYSQPWNVGVSIKGAIRVNSIHDVERRYA